MLAVIAAPATVVAATTVASAEATVAAITTLLLMTSRVLVAQTAKATTILAIVATEMTRISSKALLLRVLGKTALTTLSLAALSRRSWSARLSPESRRARSTALGVTKWLQTLVAESLLTTLLLAVRTLVRVALGPAEGVLNAAEAASTSCGTGVLRRAGS